MSWPLLVAFGLAFLFFSWWNFQEKHGIEKWFEMRSYGDPDLSLAAFTDAYARAKAGGIDGNECRFLNSYWGIAQAEKKLGPDTMAVDALGENLKALCPKWK